MSGSGGALALAAALTLVINLPFGYWRAGVRKFSPAWFVAVHGPVPLLILLRLGLGIALGWVSLPVLVAAYFSGQVAGARLRGRPA